MKSRKIVVIAFVLVAALSLSIGYAALTDQLFVNGTSELLRSNVNPVFDEKVYISSAAPDTATAANTSNTASVSTTDKDKASFTADGLTEKGDTASFVFEISNENLVAATLKATITSTYDTSLYGVTYRFASADADNKDGEIDAATDTAAATTTLTITVELLDTPQFENAEDGSAVTAITNKFDFTIDVTSVSE